MKTALLFIFLLFYSLCFTQTNKDTVNNPYYVSYRDNLQISLIGISKFNTFTITEVEDDAKEAEFSSNDNFNIGAGFTYKWMGLSLAFNLPALNQDDTLYGKTSGVDIQLDLFTKSWLFNIACNFYKSFYWENPELIYPNWNKTDSISIHSDIATLNVSLNGLMLLNNDKLSFRSVFVGNEAQLRSAGSWLAGWQISLYGMNSDNRLLPDIAAQDYPNIYRTQATSSLTLGLSFGYTYTYVTKKGLYANFVALPGINIQTVSSWQFDDKEKYTQGGLSSKFHFRFSLGYQNEKYFTGLLGVIDSYNLKTDIETRYRYTSGKVKFYLGIRF